MKLRLSLSLLPVALALSGCFGPHIYHATAKIEIRGLSTYSPSNEFEVIDSPDVLSPIITDLQLDRTWAKRLDKGTALPMQDALAYLSSKLRVAADHDTDVVAITVFSEDPNEAARIANAIANRYKTMRDAARMRLEEQGMSVLRDQITQQELVVKDTQAKAALNPQDTDLQKKNQTAQGMLDSLRIKLQQDQVDMKLSTSPVLILSLANPPSN